MTSQGTAQITFGDRCFMNLVEQAPFFLSSMWMCAFFVAEEVCAHVSLSLSLSQAWLASCSATNIVVRI